jgi:hypothetical protein
MKKRRSVRSLKGKKDFSNGVVIAMLLLLVVISIVSIALYLHAVGSVTPTFLVNEGKTTGEVAITITKAPTELGSQSDSYLNDQNIPQDNN